MSPSRSYRPGHESRVDHRFRRIPGNLERSLDPLSSEWTDHSLQSSRRTGTKDPGLPYYRSLRTDPRTSEPRSQRSTASRSYLDCESRCGPTWVAGEEDPGPNRRPRPRSLGCLRTRTTLHPPPPPHCCWCVILVVYRCIGNDTRTV